MVLNCNWAYGFAQCFCIFYPQALTRDNFNSVRETFPGHFWGFCFTCSSLCFPPPSNSRILQQKALKSSNWWLFSWVTDCNLTVFVESDGPVYGLTLALAQRHNFWLAIFLLRKVTTYSWGLNFYRQIYLHRSLVTGILKCVLVLKNLLYPSFTAYVSLKHFNCSAWNCNFLVLLLKTCWYSCSSKRRYIWVMLLMNCTWRRVLKVTLFPLL